MGWSIPIVCKVSSGIGGIAWFHVFAAPELAQDQARAGKTAHE